MPYDHDLEKFKKQATVEACAIFPGGRSQVDWLVQAIVEKVVNAYIAGYKRCEQDYHDHTGL